MKGRCVGECDPKRKQRPGEGRNIVGEPSDPEVNSPSASIHDSARRTTYSESSPGKMVFRALASRSLSG